MRAVVMAGGVGSRLEPLTLNLPKPMVTVANRPILDYVVRLLKKHGFDEIDFTLYYFPEAIRGYFGTGRDFGVNLRYFVEDAPLGTAGGVRNAGSSYDHTFLVMSGDLVTDVDLGELVKFHRAKGAVATIGLKEVCDPRSFGIVALGEDGRIMRFCEKPMSFEAGRLASTGIYVLEPEVLMHIPESGPYDFGRQLFPRLIEEGLAVYGCVLPGYWYDMGTLVQYRVAQSHVIRDMGGGAVIGRNVKIDPGARLTGDVVIGHNTRIDESTCVTGSIVWNDSYIEKDCELMDCIVADGCRIGAGSRLLAGAVLGSGSCLGEGCEIGHGVRVWPGRLVPPGSVVEGDLL